MEKSPKSESYIIKEAQNVINEYVKRKKDNKDEIVILKEKYERLKILTIGVIMAQAIILLINIISK